MAHEAAHAAVQKAAHERGHQAAHEAADEAAAAGETVRLHAGMFADLDLAGLGKEAEAVIEAHKRYACFRGIRNNLHGCCIME